VCDFPGVSDNQHRRPDRFKRQIKNGLRHEGSLRPRLAHHHGDDKNNFATTVYRWSDSIAQ
jgi:hypothetical protein